MLGSVSRFFSDEQSTYGNFTREKIKPSPGTLPGIADQPPCTGPGSLSWAGIESETVLPLYLKSSTSIMPSGSFEGMTAFQEVLCIFIKLDITQETLFCS